jgi:signal peptidase I
MNHYTTLVEKKPKTDVKPGRTILLAFFVAVLLKVFCFDFVIVEGNSMLPALKPGAVLFVNRVAYGFRLPWMKNYLLSWKRPQKNDIVVFITPMGHTAVKRCGGIAGGITDETINNMRFIALGDNEEESLDSRAYGPVPINNILGKVENDGL